MAGVPGAGGPIPKRSEQRRRTNTPAAGEPVKVEGELAEIPAADPDWHPVATRWFESLAKSGQRVFYQASDWATAYLIAESISRELQPQAQVTKEGEVVYITAPPTGAAMSAWLRGMTALLVTEGDRRRAAIELQTPAPASDGGGDVTHLEDIRQRLRGA